MIWLILGTLVTLGLIIGGSWLAFGVGGAMLIAGLLAMFSFLFLVTRV